MFRLLTIALESVCTRTRWVAARNCDKRTTVVFNLEIELLLPVSLIARLIGLVAFRIVLVFRCLALSLHQGLKTPLWL